MLLLSKYKWLGLLGIVVALVLVIGFERPPEARAFTSATCTAVTCPPNPYFFPGANPYLSGFATAVFGPTGIVFANGNIYVADVIDSNLYVFPASGVGPPVIEPIGGCSSPVGLTLSTPSPGGSGLYVACQSNNNIKEIKFDGTVVRTVTTVGSYLADMATDANGDLLVSSDFSSTIYRVTVAPVPVVTTCASGYPISFPDGIVLDQQTSMIYVSNTGNNTVAQISDIGGVCGPPTTLTTFPGGTGIDGIAVGQVGSACQATIYVNANNGNLYPVTIPAGVIGSPIATGTERGDLVKVSPDGYLFATQSASVAKIGPPCFAAPPGPTEVPTPSPTPSPTPTPSPSPSPTSHIENATPTPNASAVGGLVALPTAGSGSPVPWTPLAAVAATAMAVMGAGLWYGRRRWLR